MKLSQRWKWWRERRRHHPPDDIHRAGELAEQRLAKISRAAGKKNGWHVFESVRIPDAEQGGKREIDLVIVGGNTMLVVEQNTGRGPLKSTPRRNSFSTGRTVRPTITAPSISALLGSLGCL